MKEQCSMCSYAEAVDPCNDMCYYSLWLMLVKDWLNCSEFEGGEEVEE